MELKQFHTNQINALKTTMFNVLTDGTTHTSIMETMMIGLKHDNQYIREAARLVVETIDEIEESAYDTGIAYSSVVTDSPELVQAIELYAACVSLQVNNKL